MVPDQPNGPSEREPSLDHRHASVNGGEGETGSGSSGTGHSRDETRGQHGGFEAKNLELGKHEAILKQGAKVFVGPSAQQLWQEIVRRLWDSSIASADMTDQDERVAAQQGDEFVRWLAAQVDPREAFRTARPEAIRRVTPVRAPPVEEVAGLFAAPVATQREVIPVPYAASEVLEGSADVLMLQILVTAESLVSEPHRLAEFFRRQVAATIRRMEQEGEGTRETRVDLTVQPLIRVSEHGATLFDGTSLCTFVPGLWGYLEGQREGRSEGYYHTFFNLAQWVSQLGGRAGRELSRYYYHRLLTVGPGSVGRRVVQVAANNLAGDIAGDLQRRREHYSDRPRVLQVLNRLHMLSAIALIAESGDHAAIAAKAQAFWEALARPLADDATVAAGAVRALMNMANVPSAWEQVDWSVVDSLPGTTGESWRAFGEDWQALTSTQAALARIAFNAPEDYDEIAVAFFNAGAALARLDEESEATALLRVAVNALGLRWTLEQGRDAGQAFEEFKGTDCAVNLLGALTRVTASDAIRRAIEDLAASLVAWRAHPAMSDAALDFHRMEGSLKRLGIRVSALPRTEPSLGRTRDAVFALLAVLLPILADPQLMLPAEPRSLGPLARELRRLFDEALGVHAVQDHFAALDTLLGGLSHRAAELDEAWRTLYGAWIEGEANPVVDAGLMDPSAWKALADRAIVQVGSLANWLTERLPPFPGVMSGDESP